MNNSTLHAFSAMLALLASMGLLCLLCSPESNTNHSDSSGTTPQKSVLQPRSRVKFEKVFVPADYPKLDPLAVLSVDGI